MSKVQITMSTDYDAASFFEKMFNDTSRDEIFDLIDAFKYEATIAIDRNRLDTIPDSRGRRGDLTVSIRRRRVAATATMGINEGRRGCDQAPDVRKT